MEGLAVCGLAEPHLGQQAGPGGREAGAWRSRKGRRKKGTLSRQKASFVSSWRLEDFLQRSHTFPFRQNFTAKSLCVALMGGVPVGYLKEVALIKGNSAVFTLLMVKHQPEPLSTNQLPRHWPAMILKPCHHGVKLTP